MSKSLRERLAKYLMADVRPASAAVTRAVLAEDQAYRWRDRCTVCGVRRQWFELEPGTGRCTACQP